MRNAFVAFFMLLTSRICFSQTEPDTLHLPIQFATIADSTMKQDSIAVAIFLLNVPDSVYAQRLSALPFKFQMTYNPAVRRYIELYTVKIKDKLQIMMGLSTFYFPVFEEVLDAYGLPEELKYIPIIESALNPRAVSRARAVGLWQFMKGTGKENGLAVNTFIDQRKGTLESTKAAAQYLRRLYNCYSDWQLVLAAYNCGPGNVNRAIRRAGGKRNFWEIYRYLPRETRGYVPEFIGAAYAFNYYQEHNICPVQASLPPKTDTVVVSKQLHLEQVSAVLGLPMDLLRQINPQYIKDIIPANEKKPYSLTMPSADKFRFVQLKDSIYAYRNLAYNHQFETAGKLTCASGKGDTKKIIHQVRKGESLWTIAEQYKVSVNRMKQWNNTTGKIKQGQKLIVYLP